MDFDEDFYWNTRSPKRRSDADIPLQNLVEIMPSAEAAGELAGEYFAEKIQRLGHTISELRREIEVRKYLHQEFVGELDYQITCSATSLGELHTWGMGYNKGVDMKRNHLERQLADFRHKRRQEKLRFWEDVTRARRDLIQVMAEYNIAQRRSQLVGGAEE